MQVADVGEAGGPREAFGAGQCRVDLDEASGIAVRVRREAGAALPHGAPEGDVRTGLLPRQVGHAGQEDHLGVPDVPEAGALVDGPHMRPVPGQSVHDGGRQGTVRVTDADVPAGEQGQAGPHQEVPGVPGVRQERGRRAAHEPVDLPGVPVALADLGVGAVAQQMGAGDDLSAPLGDQRRPLGHPRVRDDLAGLALQVAQDGVHGDGDAGDDGRDMRVDQVRELVAVGAAEGAYGERGHGVPPGRVREPGAATRCGTGRGYGRTAGRRQPLSRRMAGAGGRP